MQTDTDLPRRRRWPAILIVLVLVGAGLWTAAWFYAANTVETLVESWKQREAKSGRVYRCGSQTVGGYPFRIEVRCADAVADLPTMQPPLSLKATNIVVTAQVWQLTVLTTTIGAPVTVALPGTPESIVSNWTLAQVTVHGLPTDPQKVGIALDAPTFDRVSGVQTDRLFQASRLELTGQMLEGSAAKKSGGAACDQARARRGARRSSAGRRIRSISTSPRCCAA